MIKFNFDTIVNRRKTNSVKWDFADEFFSVKDILPMWVADMDFQSPPGVITALRQAAQHGIFGYHHIPDSYYQAVISWMEKQHNWTIEKDWFVLTPGVVTALNVIIGAFTRPGDQVIVQTPVYFPFFSVIKNNNCLMLDNPMRLENGTYTMDLDDLERKITTRAKMILLCNPHNPVGRVWRREELLALGELCLKKNILIVSDEIHEDIVYPGFQHIPFTTLAPEFGEKSIVCTAASKTFNLPGLQTSNIIVPNTKLREQFSLTKTRFGIHNPNMMGVIATEAAYRTGELWLEQFMEYLKGNLSFLQQYIAEKMPQVKIIPPQGTYLVWLDFRNAGINPTRLGKFVREDARVGLEAGTIFGCREPGFERMNIACPRTILAQGLGRIEKALQALS